MNAQINLCRKVIPFFKFEGGAVNELWHIFQGRQPLKDWPISIMLLISEHVHMKKVITRFKGFGNWESASAPGIAHALHYKQAESRTLHFSGVFHSWITVAIITMRNLPTENTLKKMKISSLHWFLFCMIYPKLVTSIFIFILNVNMINLNWPSAQLQ